MIAVTIQEAKTHLERLVDQAAQGKPFVITRAGKPSVKVSALQAPTDPTAPRRLGFLAGEIAVPEDFDRMGSREIADAFGGDLFS